MISCKRFTTFHGLSLVSEDRIGLQPYLSFDREADKFLVYSFSSGGGTPMRFTLNEHRHDLYREAGTLQATRTLSPSRE